MRLHDFGEIPGGVVRRQKAELKSARRRQTVDAARKCAPGNVIHTQPYRLAGAHTSQLRFLEISHDVDSLSGTRAVSCRTRLDVLPQTNGARPATTPSIGAMMSYSRDLRLPAVRSLASDPRGPGFAQASPAERGPPCARASAQPDLSRDPRRSSRAWAIGFSATVLWPKPMPASC